MKLLYQDNRIVVCLKPAGIVSTDEAGGVPELVRRALGDPHACVRTVHRLDQVVGGVMVLARSREAARRLSAQIQRHAFQKEYLAVIHGQPACGEGEFRDLLLRDREERKTYIAADPGKDVREAVLHYRILASRDGLSLTAIRLETGRTHQIRAQFSGRGFPLVGDKKYGAEEDMPEGIALWSHRLAFCHPQTEEAAVFSAPPPRRWPWSLFPNLWTAAEVNP